MLHYTPDTEGENVIFPRFSPMPFLLTTMQWPWTESIVSLRDNKKPFSLLLFTCSSKSCHITSSPFASKTLLSPSSSFVIHLLHLLPLQPSASINFFHFSNDLFFKDGQDCVIFTYLFKHHPTVKLIAYLLEIIPVAPFLSQQLLELSQRDDPPFDRCPVWYWLTTEVVGHRDVLTGLLLSGFMSLLCL